MFSWQAWMTLFLCPQNLSSSFGLSIVLWFTYTSSNNLGACACVKVAFCCAVVKVLQFFLRILEISGSPMSYRNTALTLVLFLSFLTTFSNKSCLLSSFTLLIELSNIFFMYLSVSLYPLQASAHSIPYCCSFFASYSLPVQ